MILTTFDQERMSLIKAFFSIQKGMVSDNSDYLLRLFHFQYKYNPTYQNYCISLGISATKVTRPDQIPYLPISGFKNHEIKTGIFDTQILFESSGTTGSVRSKHHVRSLDYYLANTVSIWQNYFAPIDQFCVLALLPGYLERQGSSLINMVDYFIAISKYQESGFYLREYDALAHQLKINKARKIPTVLFGVTYALLDFVAQYQVSFSDLIIIETGGMKGQKQEITKNELHQILGQGFDVENVYSEYGMTELLSQAYTKGGKIFYLPPGLQICTHQINDPLTMEKKGKPGIISIVDMANIDSCAFIQSEDLGISYEDFTFEIIGRTDVSDLRGCNLLLQETGLL